MKISIFLAAGLGVVIFIAGLGLGYSYTAEYKLSMYDKTGMDLGPADRDFDRRYLNAMISHHRGAMLLAEQLLANTERPEMRALAQNILADEPAAIDELYVWKKEWYGDNKKVRDPLVANLGSADEKFDLRFLNAIISHHEDGIMMTKETKIKSNRKEILDNADAVELFLSEGLKALIEIRKNWYNI